MRLAGPEVGVHHLTGLDLRFTSKAWAFAADHRGRINDHWQALASERPEIWNGEVLVCLNSGIDNGVLRAELAVTDYASFLAWRDWGVAHGGAWNCFGCPVVLTADRAMIFGEMAGNTMNGGKIYPPSGSLEPRDIKPDGTVDVLGSIAIELAEETGLDATMAKSGPVLAIFDQHRIAVCQGLAFPLAADEIVRRFAEHRDAHGELARLAVIRSASGVSEAIPPFAQEIVRRFDQWFDGGVITP